MTRALQMTAAMILMAAVIALVFGIAGFLNGLFDDVAADLRACAAQEQR